MTSQPPITFNRQGPLYIVKHVELDEHGPFHENTVYFEALPAAKHHIYDLIVKSALRGNFISVEKFTATEIIVKQSSEYGDIPLTCLKIEISKEIVYG